MNSEKKDLKKVPRRYFGFHYKALEILGLGKFHHPDEYNFDNYPTLKYLFYGIFCTCFTIIGYTVAELLFAYKSWKNGRESSKQFYAFSVSVVHVFAVIKILILIKNNKKIQKIVRVLEIDCKRFDGDPKILKQSMMFTMILTRGFIIMGELTLCMMLVLAVIVDFDRKNQLHESNYTLTITRDTPFAAYVPWDLEEDWKYFFGFLYCTYGMFWVGNTLITCDTMIASIMAHISGQFKMIQKFTENIADKALDMLVRDLNPAKLKLMHTENDLSKKYYRNGMHYRFIGHPVDNEAFSIKMNHVMFYYKEEDFNDAMLKYLNQAVEYHQLIIEITEDLQTAYSQAFLCQTMSSLYVIGLILVQAAQDVSNIYSLRFANNLGFLASILWQLFIQTYTANEITIQALKVAQSAFACRWYCGDRRFARTLIYFIQRAQRPVELTAGRVAAMSNELFVTIIKSGYQIFTLITTVMTRTGKK